MPFTLPQPFVANTTRPMNFRQQNPAHQIPPPTGREGEGPWYRTAPSTEPPEPTPPSTEPPSSAPPVCPSGMVVDATGACIPPTEVPQDPESPPGTSVDDGGTVEPTDDPSLPDGNVPPVECPEVKGVYNAKDGTLMVDGTKMDVELVGWSTKPGPDGAPMKVAVVRDVAGGLHCAKVGEHDKCCDSCAIGAPCAGGCGCCGTEKRYGSAERRFPNPGRPFAASEARSGQVWVRRDSKIARSPFVRIARTAKVRGYQAMLLVPRLGFAFAHKSYADKRGLKSYGIAYDLKHKDRFVLVRRNMGDPGRPEKGSSGRDEPMVPTKLPRITRESNPAGVVAQGYYRQNGAIFRQRVTNPFTRSSDSEMRMKAWTGSCYPPGAC